MIDLNPGSKSQFFIMNNKDANIVKQDQETLTHQN